MTTTSFKIKPILWSEYDHHALVLLQDENGPCALIALVNTVILKHQIESRKVAFGELHRNELQERRARAIESLQARLGRLEAEKKSISLNSLLESLGEVLLELFENEQYPEYDVDRLVSSLPLLHTGLTVDPILTDITFPKSDLASVLFGIFSLSFKHGWCLDPNEDPEAFSFFSQYPTFDRAQDCFIQNPQAYSHAQEWLAANRSQLTSFGLRKIDSVMEDDELAVFFRNNHFSTLYKKGPGEFYLLVTDEAFNSHRRIVWQSLNSVSGKDELFFTGDFVPVFLDDSTDHGATDMSDDYLLMKQLQEEDDMRMARNIQKLYNKPTVKPEKEGKEAKTSKPQEKSQEKKKKKKTDCVVM